MRILIFGLPRCGTTSLHNFLIESLPKNYVVKYEPFKRVTDVNFGEDCIIKTVLTDEEHDPIILKDGETLLTHSFRIIKEFDKVIYIKRKKVNNIKMSFSNFHRLKNSKEISNKIADVKINEWNEIFNIVSQNKKVYYYEDIFTDKPKIDIIEICNYLNIIFNIDLFNKILHIKNKDVVKKLDKSLI
jgi:hypothetical protein